MKKTTPPSFHLDKLPGHLMRRMHQISVGIFMSEAEATGLTPIQFAALQTVSQQPGIDQKTLAKGVALDTSTTGGVIDRLEARGWIERRSSDSDRRVRLLTLTSDGEKALQDAIPMMLATQEKILSPLSETDRKTFMKLLNQLVNENNEFSRAPSQSAK
jgi:MarR family transcriptional regulator, lower aerobic nicotinate degradation pathway regulator